MTILGRILVSTSFGVMAGVVFAVLPQVSWSATEARSTAVVTAIAVWLMVATVKLTEDRSSWWHAAFVALAAVGVAVNIFSGLALLAIVLTVALAPPWRPHLRRLLVDSALAIAVSSPVVIVASTQTDQVAWLPGFHLGTVRQVIEHQWFGDAMLFAVLAWTLMLGTALGFLGRRRYHAAWTGWDVGAALGSLLLVVPTAVLIAITVAGHHFYQPRYVAPSLPGVALLIAGGIAGLGRRWRHAFVVVPVILSLTALGSFMAQRQVTAKGHEWSAAMGMVQQATSRRTPVYLENSGSLLPLRILYPSVFRQHPDIGLGTSHLADDELWDQPVSTQTAVDRARAYPDVVVVAHADDWAQSRDLKQFRAAGFAPAQTRPFGDLVVVSLTRGQ
jgi:mannosyltransferase